MKNFIGVFLIFTSLSSFAQANNNTPPLHDINQPEVDLLSDLFNKKFVKKSVNGSELFLGLGLGGQDDRCNVLFSRTSLSSATIWISGYRFGVLSAKLSAGKKIKTVVTIKHDLDNHKIIKTFVQVGKNHDDQIVPLNEMKKDGYFIIGTDDVSINIEDNKDQNYLYVGLTDAENRMGMCFLPYHE